MAEKQGIPSSEPHVPPPPYQQTVGYQGYQGPQGYGSNPGVPSYAAQGQPRYNTNYGAGQQPLIVRQPGSYGYTPGVNLVPDNMVLAVLATVLCCWPIGIFAILRAQDARRAQERGDIPTAIMLSAQSKRYSMISIALGVVMLVVVVIILAVVLTTSSYYY